MANVGGGHKSLFSAVNEHLDPRDDGQRLELGLRQFADFKDVIWADVGAVAGAFAFVHVDDRGDDLRQLFAIRVGGVHRVVTQSNPSYCSCYMSVCSN